MNGRTLSVLLLVVLAGCNGALLNGTHQPTAAGEQTQQLRLVVQNEAASNQTIDLTLRSKTGKPVLNQSKALEPGEVWVVSMFNVSSLDTPVTVTAHLPKRGYTTELVPIRSTERGARLHTITDDGISLFECNANTTCWKQKPETL